MDVPPGSLELHCCKFGDVGMIMERPRRKTGDVSLQRNRLLFVTFTVAVVTSTLVATVDGVNLQLRGSTVRTDDNNSDHGGGRVKRQLPPIEVGNQLVDSIFQIPISTLNAVGSVIKNARPLVRFTRERIQQYYNNDGQQQPAVSQQQYGYNRPMSQYGFNVPTYFGNKNNRKKQQRDDPLPEGRIHRHSVSTDY